jgi:quercetin dioxygenase-like cupin family protein
MKRSIFVRYSWPGRTLRLCLCGFVFMTALAPFAADNAAKIDNDQARILVVNSAPDVKSALHKHDMNRVMIYLDAGKMTLTDPNGKVETLSFKAGEALWSPAGGLHTSLNVSGHAVRIVEVELKSKPGRASTLKQSALDPIKVDPKRYKVELENDQVRVFRVRYEPHGKGVTHEHTLNRVVTFITDGNMKVATPDGEAKILKTAAGDVTWGGPARHVEENLSDQPFEVVVVEFKQ